MPRTSGLTPAEVDAFTREGYVVVEHAVEPAVLDRVDAEIDAVLGRLAREAVERGELTEDFAGLPLAQRLAAVHRQTPSVFEALHGRGRLNGPAVFDVLTDERLLDCVASLVGEEIVASSVYRIRAKAPGGVGQVAWHQDSGFFEPYCDNALIVTCWVPLVDSTLENGCLWVWPGAHRDGLRRHVPAMDAGGLGLARDALPRDEGVPVPVPRGGAVLFTNLTPHASFANVSDHARFSLDMRYQSADLVNNAGVPPLLDPDDEADRPVACYPPEADCLVRSTRNPELVVRDAAAFRALRESHVPGRLSRQWPSEDGQEVWPPESWYASVLRTRS